MLYQELEGNNMESHRQDLSSTLNDFVTIDLNKQPLPAAIDITQYFPSASEAFKSLLDETVLKAVSQTYAPPMTFLQAVIDAFYNDNSFSWKQTITLTGSVIAGGAASIFIVKPAGDAAQIIADIIKARTGKIMPAVTVLKTAFQIGGTGEAAAIATLSTRQMISAYFGSTSNTEKYLTYHKATWYEKAVKVGRQIFNLCCGIASSFPAFVLTKTSIPLALVTTLANIPINWMGVSNLSLNPRRILPARRAELMYLHEQLEDFLKLPLKDKYAVINEMHTLQQHRDDPLLHKKLLLRLFKLSAPSSSVVSEHVETKINASTSTSYSHQAFSVTTGVTATLAELSFMETGGVGVARLLNQGASPAAISAGIATALLALLPCVGFGYTAGYEAGKSMLTQKIPLAEIFNEKVRDALKWLLHFISFFAGSTFFTLGYSAVNDFTSAIKLKGPLEYILQIFIPSICFIGGAIENDYYTFLLLDEILIYFAQRCGDENIKRLYNFVLETRKAYGVLADSNDENYLSILKYKLELPSESNPIETELSEIIHHLLNNRLSEPAYQKLRLDLNNSRIILRERYTLDPQQIISPVKIPSHSSLRQRFGCRFFSCRESVANEPVDLEMQMQPSRQ